MVSFLGGIVETITNFFQQLVDSGYLTLDYIFYVSLAFELILIIFFLIKSSYSYELRLDRSLDGLNRWLYYNQYIDESNLMEFNQKIKKSPKLLRYHWQQYMLYRDSDPSHYMSEYNCIEKPLHTSSFTSNIKNLTTICYTLAATTFLLNLASFATIGQTNIGYVLINSLLTPIAIWIFSTFFTILLRSWQNANLSGLYQNFHLFTRYIDKGCTTLPEYIDFEVLFTKEEIKKGIPVLNEYLEKRARQEQKELEAAMLNSVEHEEYDFAKLGLNGSQILDRAMRETEIYINQRHRTLAEIQQLEGEIESAKRNYENNQKEYERKMQASKENVDRLRKQQEESTNRIESNYIRKQQTDEIKKQEQLEKDYESVTMRYNQEINSLTSEINTRKLEIEEKKKNVEEAMKAEYNTFSSRVFKAINEDIQEKEKDEKTKLIEEKDNYSALFEQSNIALEEKERKIQSLQEILKKANIDLGDHGEFYDENLRKEEQNRHSKSKFSKKDKIEEQSQTITETTVTPVQIQESITAQEPTYDEYGGYYDEQGYYRYKNGTYYDPEGNFFDEFGGHYDKDGNYFEPEQHEEQQSKNIVEQSLTDEFGGHYDEQGNYVYNNGSYYDSQGMFHDVENVMQDEQTKTEEIKFAEVKPEETVQNLVTEQKEAEQTTQSDLITDIKELQPETIQEEQPVVFEELEQPETKQEEAVGDQKEKRGRGRPRKEVTEQEPTEKRGRGRPRKEVSEIEVTTKKAGRGRPRKVVNDDDENEGKKKVKAGRGRPRKITPTEKKPAGKRGRPKKDGKIVDELDKINAQIEEENKKLQEQHEELSKQIDNTLSKLDEQDSDNNSSNNA